MAEGPPSDNLYVADLPPDVDEALIYAIFQEYGTVQQCRTMQAKFPGQKGAALVRFSSVQEAQWIVDNLNGAVVEGLPGALQVRFATNKAAHAAAAEKGLGGKGGSYGYGYGDGGYGRGGGHSYGKAGPSWNGHGKGGYDGPRVVPYCGGKGSTIVPCSGGGGKHGPVAPPRGAGATCSVCDIDTLVGGLIAQQALPGQGRKPDENCLYIKGLPYNTTDGDLYRLFSPFGAIPPKGVKTNITEEGTCSGVAWVDFCDAAAAKAAIEALNGTELPDGVVLQVSQKTKKLRV